MTKWVAEGGDLQCLDLDLAAVDSSEERTVEMSATQGKQTSNDVLAIALVHRSAPLGR